MNKIITYRSTLSNIKAQEKSTFIIENKELRGEIYRTVVHTLGVGCVEDYSSDWTNVDGRD